MKALLMTIGIAFLLTGCNTVEGVGEDIQAAGGAIEKTAQQTKPEEKKPAKVQRRHKHS